MALISVEPHHRWRWRRLTGVRMIAWERRRRGRGRVRERERERERGFLGNNVHDGGVQGAAR